MRLPQRVTCFASLLMQLYANTATGQCLLPAVVRFCPCAGCCRYQVQDETRQAPGGLVVLAARTRRRIVVMRAEEDRLLACGFGFRRSAVADLSLVQDLIRKAVVPVRSRKGRRIARSQVADDAGYLRKNRYAANVSAMCWGQWRRFRRLGWERPSEQAKRMTGAK